MFTKNIDSIIKPLNKIRDQLIQFEMSALARQDKIDSQIADLEVEHRELDLDVASARNIAANITNLMGGK